MHQEKRKISNYRYVMNCEQENDSTQALPASLRATICNICSNSSSTHVVDIKKLWQTFLIPSSVHQQDAKSSLLDERATAHISRTIDGGLFKHL
jgi:hypothetical protein